ncbi:uncharacterized protein TNCV_4733941 [Trichonephila clavipes]|nr:uncharacterized protein TNCV_4733941 [Trichonephila clavipes]
MTTRLSWSLFYLKNLSCRPSGIVISNADGGAVGPGFEFRRRHGCLKMYSAFAAWDTLNSRRAASPLGRLGEGEESWKAPDHPQGVLPQNWGGTEQNRTVTYMVLKAKANDRRKNLAPSRDEFRGP